MNKMPALYELAKEFIQTANALNDMDLDEQTIADTLEGCLLPVEEKAKQVGFVIRNIESLVDQIKAAEQSMAARRKALESRAASVRAYLLKNMQDCGITRIESPFFVLSVRKNPPSVVVDDLQALESDCPQFILTKVEKVADKKAIKEAIESGHVLNGAHLERKDSLQIK